MFDSSFLEVDSFSVEFVHGELAFVAIAVLEFEGAGAAFLAVLVVAAVGLAEDAVVFAVAVEFVVGEGAAIEAAVFEVDLSVSVFMAGFPLAVVVLVGGPHVCAFSVLLVVLPLPLVA